MAYPVLDLRAAVLSPSRLLFQVPAHTLGRMQTIMALIIADHL